ncbi:MAG: aminopeptidase [Deltaproteobacteria bacterium]|nr:aminopeptidase [Deltaproteobacteria bacterium]
MRNRIFFYWVFAAVVLSGCQTASYYAQAVNGQLNILRHRRPIDQILSDPQVDASLKNRLEFVLEIREFAKKELLLPVDNQYSSYVDLRRPYAVWTVFAAPEFSLMPKTWCFPIAGCTAYRSYFSENDAQRFAGRLSSRGYDIYVGGAMAYSTLGWFDDPVLNTVIHLDDVELAALFFHELAHHIVYVKDDSTFNESFATAVEQEGLRRWLMASANHRAYENYMTNYRRNREFIQLVMKYRRRLEALYDTNLSIREKRQNKARIYRSLGNAYEQLKQHWKGYSGFDDWFSPPPNNAKIVSVSTYHDFVPHFLKMIEKNQGDLGLFYKACRKQKKKPKAERDLGLQAHSP